MVEKATGRREGVEKVRRRLLVNKKGVWNGGFWDSGRKGNVNVLQLMAYYS
jgi:hypothetical protein